MTRVILSSEYPPPRWVAPSTPISNLTSTFGRDTILSATKRDERSWRGELSPSEADTLDDFLENVVLSNLAQQTSHESDFHIGPEGDIPLGAFPDSFFSPEWQLRKQERLQAPESSEDTLDAWDRIMGKTIPLARELEIFDPHLYKGDPRFVKDSGFKTILRERIQWYPAEFIDLYFEAHDNEGSQVASAQLEEYAKAVRDSVDRRPGRIRFFAYKRPRSRKPHDRWIHARYKHGQILWSLTHGLDTFAPHNESFGVFDAAFDPVAFRRERRQQELEEVRFEGDRGDLEAIS